MTDAIKRLLSEQPMFHNGVSCAVDPDLLTWLVAHVPEGAQTLETGSGYSTVAFLHRSGRHTIVTPAPDEPRLIKEWCEAHDVPVSAMNYVCGGSVEVLPRLVDDGELDVVLIDGDHAFPVPAVDWLYTAARVKVGGYVLVDDVQLRPCRILRDFLRQEHEWQECSAVGRTSVFRKTQVLPAYKGWNEQPWSAAALYPVGGEPLKERLQLLRGQARLRTRLRAALAARRPGGRPVNR